MKTVKIKKADAAVKPWPHQREAIQAFHTSLVQGKKKMAFVLATGTGKTNIAIWCIDDFLKLYGHGRVLFISHLEQIWSQLDERFEAVAPHISRGCFMAGEERSLNATVINASVYTIASRIKSGTIPFTPKHFKAIIIDEFHHAATATYKTLFKYFTPEILVGMSCIKERHDAKDFLKYFGNNIVYELDTIEAIKRRAIAGLRYIALKDDIDYSIHKNGFAYKERDQNRKLIIPKKDLRVIERWQEIAPGKKTIVFCANIRHAERIVELLHSMHVSAVSVHYGLAPDVISKRTVAFRTGKVQVAVTIDKWLEGADFPDAEVALLLRPTKSWRIFVQARGRVLRRIPGVKETGIVIDAVGNHKWIGTYKHLVHERAQFAAPSGSGGDHRAELTHDPGLFALDISEVADIFALTGERQFITQEQAIAKYRELEKKKGKQPTITEYASKGHSIEVLERLYGRPGWRNFLKDMGKEALRSFKITRRQAREKYRELEKNKGRQPTGLEFAAEGYGIAKLDYLYGCPGWRNFLKSMGKDVLYSSQITRRQAKEKYRELEKNKGRQPTYTEYASEGYGIAMLVKLYGRPGWRNFLKDMRKESLRFSQITRRQAKEKYRELEKNKGRQPTGTEYASEGYGIAMLVKLYGRPGWRNFLKSMGKDALHSFYITRAQVLKKYRALEKKKGRQPTSMEFYAEGCNTIWIVRLYGRPAWRNFLKSMGKVPLSSRKRGNMRT